MNEEQYMKLRLDNQISWFDKKSGMNKRMYRGCQVIQLLAASLVTLSGAFSELLGDHSPYLVASLGALIAIITGILGLYKYQENWIQYRTTSETLKHEKFLFLTRSKPYHGSNPLQLLVERVEALISKENTNWGQYMGSSEEDQS